MARSAMVAVWLVLAIVAVGCDRRGRQVSSPSYPPPPAGPPPPGAQQARGWRPPAPRPPAARPVTSTTAPPPAPAAPAPWSTTCSPIEKCGVCINRGPCEWCEADHRCVAPGTSCVAMPTPAARVSSSKSSCFEGPLEVAKARYPTLAKELGRYELQREEKDIELTEGEEFTWFVNTGDCFAVLVEPQPGDTSQASLGFSLRIRGTPRPGERVAPPVKGTGGRAGPVQLSPEFCPWDHQPLAIWNAAPKTTTGRVRMHLLRRAHPDPARLAREQTQAAPPPRTKGGAPIRGGSCSSMECGEDCRSELRACKLDCFRHGRHGPGGQSGCEAVCKQMERSCHRGCRIPCNSF